MNQSFDFDAVLARHDQFWAGENDTPILLLQGTREPAAAPVPPAAMEERWLNIEYLLRRERARLENSFFPADAFPLVNPNLGPDIFGASLGADLIFEETTSYSVPFVRDWTEEIVFRQDNPWWRRIQDITRAFVEDGKGAYLVGVTDLHAGVDGLVSIRGPQELCLDVFDRPEVFETAKTVLLPAFEKQFETLCSMTQTYRTGVSNWMGLYRSTPWYVTSCDFICMLSQEHFRELVLPELLMEIRYLKGSTIFHLDGPDALRHLDDLLAIPDLAGIQWVYGAGQPGARHWIDVLQKIQNAGKLINIGLQPEDVEPVFRALRPQGLSCYFDFDYTEREALEILDLAHRIYKGG